MKIAPAQIENFLTSTPPTCRVFLFYGPDEGMNRMRAQSVIRKKLGEKPDPFALVEFQAGELSDDPARLLDEIQTLPFGGDRKVIYIRQASENLTAVITQAIESCPKFSTLILEAGELSPKSALRQAVESADSAAAIPAYDDEGRGLEKFIRDFMAASGTKLSGDAMPALLSLLSANRMVNRQELEKLLLYIEPINIVTEQDVESALAAQTNLGLDDVVYAAFSGDAKTAAAGLQVLRGEGMSGIPILRALSRHAMRLHWVLSMIQAGSNRDEAIKMLRPPVFFKKLRAFEHHLRLWPMPGLLRLSNRLLAAEISSKSTGYPADDIAGQIIMGIAIQSERAA